MDEKQFITSDLSLAAFLSMKGVSLIKCTKIHTGRFEFIFNDVNNEAPNLSVIYLGSEFCKFDNQVRILKKMLYKN